MRVHSSQYSNRVHHRRSNNRNVPVNNVDNLSNNVGHHDNSRKQFPRVVALVGFPTIVKEEEKVQPCCNSEYRQ